MDYRIVLFKRVLSILLVFCVYFTHTQEIPPIDIYTPQEYGAEDQNWAISQSATNEMYFANNKGLLEYNGERWQLYPTPNESILRSVNVIDNKIYTGCYMDFGFWVKDDLGKLNYTSLVNKFSLELIEDEQFWNIVSLDNHVLFQSLNRIYIYNSLDNSFNTISSATTLTKTFRVGDAIYFQKINEGLFVIEKGKERLVTNSSVIKGAVITNIFKQNRGLLFQTKEKGFFLFEDNLMKVWNESLNKLLVNNSIYSSIRLKNGNYILGTVSHGIIHLSENGEILLRIDQGNGLSNNTVLSIFEDTRGNIWLGLDNGINIVNINSPIRVFNDVEGVLGTVYASVLVNGELYLGTNHGLFIREENPKKKFKFIEGTEGQVWFLGKIGDTVFCGHDKGTFVINNENAKLISEIQGTWKIQQIESNPNILIQGNYAGLFILEYAKGNWQIRNKLEGFDISSRYFEVINNNEILVNHEYKGVYRLNISNNFLTVDSYDKVSISKGEKSSLVNFNNNIYYCYNDGIFRYDQTNTIFVKDEHLSSVVNDDNYVSGEMLVDDSSNRLWFFSENSLSYAELGKLTEDHKITSISFPGNLRRTKAGYENILPIDNNEYLIGSTDGYLIVDLNKAVSNTKNVSVALSGIYNYSLNENPKPLSLTSSEILPNKSNNISFYYTVTNYNKFEDSKYQYRLKGFNDNWSTWSSDSSILFENLPHGSYHFEVRAKVGNQISDNIVKYNFQINKPWFLKPVAIVSYVIFFLLLLLLIHWLNRKHYKKQRQQILRKKERELEIKELENQKQLMQFNNKNLQQDIDNKNRELGMSTMNLIKKNELLNEIKVELDKIKKLDELKSVKKLINKNLNTSDDWKLFEEAFNNADKDFLKNAKKAHPELTSNDLRLCAYLRLNLSSKEIAPLLNISPRSVEVKRYRLRKKMNLDHNVNLTNYILNL